MLKNILIVIAAISLWSCAEPDLEVDSEVVRPVRYMQVGLNKSIAERRFPGRAQAANEVSLAFEVPGKLKEVIVSVGDKVQRGDVLAVIDDRDYKNALNQAKAEAQRAKAQYQRMKKALADKAVSKQNVSDAKAAYESASAVLSTRQKALDDTRLLAPYDAVVSATFVDNYGNVQAKQPAVRIVDPRRIEMKADIPESMIAYAERGMEVYVSFDAIPGMTMLAKVNDIGAEADEATRTFPVTFIMDQPEDVKIFPGMAGEAWPANPQQFLDKAPEEFQGYVLPLTAILSKSDQQTVVWVIDPESKTVSSRAVQLGDMTESGVLVRGLEGGEYVATAGVHHLREQQKVRLNK